MLATRAYGKRDDRTLFTLHGGPGAPGQMRPVARRLGADFYVIEPLQRLSGGAALTVATHIEDLHDLVVAAGADQEVVLVGWSWGAMLALAMPPYTRSPCTA